MDNIVLVDGDLLPYRIGFACQTTTYSIIDPNGKVVESGLKGKRTAEKYMEADHPDCTLEQVINVQELSHALHTVKVVLQDILKSTGCDCYRVYLTGKNNFRDEVATLRKYKGNRDGTSKPVLHGEIRQYLIDHHGAMICNGIEADDAVSIVQMTYRAKGARSVIATYDKDLNGTPGLHYDFRSNVRKLYDVSEDEAIRYFYKQVLMGDLSTDNIQGIPGIGETKADKILEGVPATDVDLYKACLAAYKKYYDKKPKEYYHWNDALEENPIEVTPENMLLENARLVYMMREPVTNPIKLWEAPDVPEEGRGS